MTPEDEGRAKAALHVEFTMICMIMDRLRAKDGPAWLMEHGPEFVLALRDRVIEFHARYAAIAPVPADLRRTQTELERLLQRLAREFEAQAS